MKKSDLYTQGRPVTNSVLVADKFHESHDDVLQAINKLIEDNPSLELEVQKGECFLKSFYYDSQNKPQPAYIIDYNGFWYLVFNLTGEAAKRFILDFTDFCNEVEAIEVPDPSKLSEEEKIQISLMGLKLKQKHDLLFDFFNSHLLIPCPFPSMHESPLFYINKFKEPTPYKATGSDINISQN